MAVGLSKQICWISIIVTFSAILRLICDQPVVSGGDHLSTWQNPPPNLQVTCNFLAFPSCDSNWDSVERQLAVSAIAYDHMAIGAGPQIGWKLRVLLCKLYTMTHGENHLNLAIRVFIR